LVIAFVFDSSAILALLHREPGADIVRAALATACISAANYAEVVTKLIEEGLPFGQAETYFTRLYCPVIEVDEDRAALAGAMHEETRRTGLSLGDRFCLQLARELHVPVLTTDTRWKSLDLGVEVTLIR
jgi:ribonuclease VapC